MYVMGILSGILYLLAFVLMMGLSTYEQAGKYQLPGGFYVGGAVMYVATLLVATVLLMVIFLGEWA